MPILCSLLQQTKCNFSRVCPTWTQTWPLNFPGPFWPFFKLQWPSQTGSPTLPRFSTLCTFSTFPLAILPFSRCNQVCFQAAGGSLVHTCILHILRLLSQGKRSSSLAPPEPSRGAGADPRGCVCMCERKREHQRAQVASKTKQLLIARSQGLCLLEEFPSLTFADKKKTLLHLASPSSSSRLSNTNNCL